MQIREATSDDIAAIVRIRTRGWQQAYRGILPDDLLDGLQVDEETVGRTRASLAEDDGRNWWVAEQDGGIAGFCITGPARDDVPGTGEILLLYVDPDRWAAGAGGELLAHGVADLRARGFARLVLWTLEKNERARRFYERHGWVCDGATKPFEYFGEVVSTEVRYRLP